MSEGGRQLFPGIDVEELYRVLVGEDDDFVVEIKSPEYVRTQEGMSYSAKVFAWKAKLHCLICFSEI